jgi:hypothetical protein
MHSDAVLKQHLVGEHARLRQSRATRSLAFLSLGLGLSGLVMASPAGPDSATLVQAQNDEINFHQ